MKNHDFAAGSKIEATFRQLMRIPIMVNTVNVAVPFLDHLLGKMNSRLSTSNCSAVKGFSIIPSSLKPKDEVVMASNKRKYDDAFAAGKNDSPENLYADTATSSNDITISSESNDQPPKANGTVLASNNKFDEEIQIQRLDKEW